MVSGEGRGGIGPPQHSPHSRAQDTKLNQANELFELTAVGLHDKVRAPDTGCGGILLRWGFGDTDQDPVGAQDSPRAAERVTADSVDNHVDVGDLILERAGVVDHGACPQVGDKVGIFSRCSGRDPSAVMGGELNGVAADAAGAAVD